MGIAIANRKIRCDFGALSFGVSKGFCAFSSSTKAALVRSALVVPQ